jgi:MFS family permease
MAAKAEMMAADTGVSPASDRWVILGVLFAARTVVAFQFQSVPALGPFVVNELGIDYALLGTLVGVYMLPGVVLAVPGGVLGQRFGDKRITLVGLLLMAAGGIALAVAPSFAVAAVGRLCSGIGAVLLNIVLAKMVTDWFAEREIVLAMALFVSSWPVGIGAALLVLPALAGLSGTSVALGSSALLSGLALVLIATVYRIPPSYVPSAATFRIQMSGREWALSILAGMVWALYNVGFILLLVFTPSFLTGTGMTVAAAGATTSLVTWTILLSLPLGGYLAQKLNSSDLVMGGCFLALAALACALGLGVSPVLVCGLLGVLAGPPPGLIMALPGSALRPHNRMAGMGVYYACYYAAMAGLVPLAGALRDTTGDAATPVYFAAALMVATAISLLGFRIVERRAAPAAKMP